LPTVSPVSNSESKEEKIDQSDTSDRQEASSELKVDETTYVGEIASTSKG
jgi:hypothetical protein